MEDVSFNEENFTRRSVASRQPSALSRFVIKLGLAKTESGAQIVLLIIAVVAALAAVAVFITTNHHSRTLAPQEAQQLGLPL